MVKSEKVAMDKFISEGWTVYRSGWPDFLLIRRIGDSIEAKAVEVKSYRGKPSAVQTRMFEALKSIGISVTVLEIGRFEYVVDRVFDRLVRDAGDDDVKISRINGSREKVMAVVETSTDISVEQDDVERLGDLLYCELKEKLLGS